MKTTDRPRSIFGNDPPAAHDVLMELQQHNARLAQLVAELLIKNQDLRSELQRVGAMRIIERTFALPEEAA